MKKTSVYLDESQDVRLSEVAFRRGTSRAHLIREAIAAILDAETNPTPRPRPLGRSGHSETSEQVDEILAGGFGA